MISGWKNKVEGPCVKYKKTCPIIISHHMGGVMGREKDSESEFLSRSHLNLGPHFPHLYIGTFEGYVAFFF